MINDKSNYCPICDKSTKERSASSVKECYYQINELINNDIECLYNSIDNFLFQDIDYDMVSGLMPQWVSDAGISPELICSKDWYDKMRKDAAHPIFGRFIYYYDLWTKVAAIQDRLSAVILFMRNLYEIVPSIANYVEDQYTAAARCGGEQETNAHIYLNGVFIAYASVFDILSKIAVEQNEFPKYDFAKYKKMKSSDVIYKKNLANIHTSLKSEEMLFSEPLVIRIIETFRNEYVHNGPWDLRCSIYNTAVDGEPADVIIYSPDIDETGIFVRSGSRNKFYSQSNRINIQLPKLISGANKIIKQTINQLCILYQQNTNEDIDKSLTKDCLKAISDYYKSLYGK